jgi:hypothetical protein
MPYYKKTIDDKIVAKACAASMPSGDGWSLIEGDPSEVEVYQEPQPEPYNSNTLITWAMGQIFTQELIPHFAAFLDFANKANDESCANFLAYATAVGLLDTAETIVSKAIELGATITVGE